jgi:transcription initiation factor IIE alpha subunit
MGSGMKVKKQTLWLDAMLSRHGTEPRLFVCESQNHIPFNWEADHRYAFKCPGMADERKPPEDFAEVLAGG